MLAAHDRSRIAGHSRAILRYKRPSCGYAAFASWLRANQLECDFFYSGAPDLTVDDLRVLSQLANACSGGPSARRSREQASDDNGYRALAALYELKK